MSIGQDVLNEAVQQGKNLLKDMGKKLVNALITNPIFWAVVGIVLIIIIICGMFIEVEAQEAENTEDMSEVSEEDIGDAHYIPDTEERGLSIEDGSGSLITTGGEIISSDEPGVISKFKSYITGKTYYVFNQSHGEINLPGNCNNAAAASISSGYSDNWKDVIKRAQDYVGGYLLSASEWTSEYFSAYGLGATIQRGNEYSIDNIRTKLCNGQYVTIHFKPNTYGKSTAQYSGSKNPHWIAIIGYKKNADGTEQIYVSDSGWRQTGWKDIDEFEICKSNMNWFTTIYEK